MFLWQSYRERGKFNTKFLAARQFIKVRPRHRDCLPQARGFRTGKNTIYIKHLHCQMKLICYWAMLSDTCKSIAIQLPSVSPCFCKSMPFSWLEVAHTPPSCMTYTSHLYHDAFQGALKGTNLRGQTEPKRRFSQFFADFCRFSPFPRKRSIWETQIFAENRRFSQETAGNRRLAFVPLGSSP